MTSCKEKRKKQEGYGKDWRLLRFIVNLNTSSFQEIRHKAGVDWVNLNTNPRLIWRVMEQGVKKSSGVKKQSANMTEEFVKITGEVCLNAARV
jgi:hypothetical protein